MALIEHYIVKCRIGILFLVSLFFLAGCAEKSEFPERNTIELSHAGSIQINNQIHQPENIMEGFRVVQESGMVYGIDYRKKLPYKLSLKTGTFEHLSSAGSGPTELRLPSQITEKNSSEFYVYDTNLNVIARFVNDEVVEKAPGFLGHNVWPRNTKGYYWNNRIITSIKEPEKVNALDFENARPLAFLNLADSSLTKHGEFSPTIDELDTLQKYPILAFDEESATVYYVFRSDYTVMKYDISEDFSGVASSYKPAGMRTRTITFDHNNNFHYTLQFSRSLNEDRTQLVNVDILENQLVVVHQNTDARFYDDRDPKFLKYFGVIYDLPELKNPREFSLPGKFLGVWNSMLLIEENDDVLEYTIGFYEFVD